MATRAKVSQPASYLRLRAVALPILNLGTETQVTVRIEAPMVSGAPIRRGKARTTLQVIRLDDGFGYTLILDDVLRAIFSANYPDATYIGHLFEITRHARASGRRTYSYSVFEVKA